MNEQYLRVDGVDEVGEGSVEEELVVSDSRRLVLLLEDFVVVKTELEVGCPVPKGFLKWISNMLLLVESSPEVLLRSLSVFVET